MISNLLLTRSLHFTRLLVFTSHFLYDVRSLDFFFFFILFHSIVFKGALLRLRVSSASCFFPSSSSPFHLVVFFRYLSLLDVRLHLFLCLVSSSLALFILIYLSTISCLRYLFFFKFIFLSYVGISYNPSWPFSYISSS